MQVCTLFGPWDITQIARHESTSFTLFVISFELVVKSSRSSNKVSKFTLFGEDHQPTMAIEMSSTTYSLTKNPLDSIGCWSAVVNDDERRRSHKNLRGMDRSYPGILRRCRVQDFVSSWRLDPSKLLGADGHISVQVSPRYREFSSVKYWFDWPIIMHLCLAVF